MKLKQIAFLYSILNYGDIENLQKGYSKRCKIVFKQKTGYLKLKVTKLKSFVAASNLLVNFAFFSFLLHGSKDICSSPAKCAYTFVLYLECRYIQCRRDYIFLYM